MDRTTSPTTPLFALLVGINDYLCQGPELQRLRGAVNDVKEFKSYLETYLSVPTDHIAVLIDAQATRGKIIQALQDLSKDERIKEGDAILVYYAGHGIELDAPENWEAGGPNAKIQGIVPYDCDFFGANLQPDVAPIPDLVLDNLLSKIATIKGDNITVILDCCHSASGTRELPMEPRPVSSHKSENVDVRIRAATLARTLPRYRLDDLPASHENTSSWKSYIPSILSPRGLASHVLIAACDRGEKAHEDGVHGRFSVALLKLLKSVSPSDLLYSDIFKHQNFGIDGQNPHCEGLNIHRSLFNWKVLPADQRKTFDVQYAPKSGEEQYMVDGGAIHSLNTNSKFSVYRKSDLDLSNRLGILHVDHLGPLTLTAKLAPGYEIFDTDTPTVAIQIDTEKMHHPLFHIHSDDDFHNFVQDSLQNWHILKPFLDHCVVAPIDQPNKAPKVNRDQGINSKWTVNMAHGYLSRKLGPIITKLDPEPEDLDRALSTLARRYKEAKFFYKHSDLPGKISIEFYKLQMTRKNTEYVGALEAVGPNLYVNDTVRLVIPKVDEGDTLYGMKITNNWSQDLDVNIYRFSNDLSIKPCAESGASQSYRRHDLPLKCSGRSMTIGYGDPGYPPMCFKMNDGLETEVLFLKIYLSTQVVNLSQIAQEAPLASTRAMSEYRPKPKVTWADILVPVILCRRQSRSPGFLRRNWMATTHRGIRDQLSKTDVE